MKNSIMRLISGILSAILVFALIGANLSMFACAEESNDDPFIVVSMGDSYSSGEGIPAFYGGDKTVEERVKDEDWLAHRSKKSWPGLLDFPGYTGTSEDDITIKNYRVKAGEENTESVQWYFVAASGATTEHFKNKQVKEYDQDVDGFWDLRGEKELPAQLDVFKTIDAGETDYVTLTIGGNDVGFSDIIFNCAVFSSHVHLGKTGLLEENLNDLLNNFDRDTKPKLRKAYTDIKSDAGAQAEIIVAGYPKLLKASGGVINADEARMVNDAVSEFNDKIENLILELDNSMNIHFVDVETEFDKDGGHQAYSAEPWINPIEMPAKSQDLNQDDIKSQYSIHPNEEGAKAYARCVNAKIAEIEERKNTTGTLSGKICKASDRTTPVTDATIQIIKDGSTRTLKPESDGTYSIELPVGTYLVKVTADGYIEFNAFATIESRQEVFMETFLMVEGEESDIGEAIGTITNALTGNGVEGVTLDVRSGWNNTDSGDILTTVTTNASGDYTVTLPIGNYTLCASKAGYISTTINVVVQPNMCTTKNASMTPVISGDNFRIVLTWGASPSDLDSHVVGNLSTGGSFHVYYSHKSEYDGDIEVCNLDVDDTTSYGPETITLNTVTNDPYYYYIYNYSSSTGMITSEAQIKVYQGENLVATFNVPTNQADARYWNVFAIVNGELIVNNTITSSADLSYAGDASNASIMMIDVEADIAKSTK